MKYTRLLYLFSITRHVDGFLTPNYVNYRNFAAAAQPKRAKSTVDSYQTVSVNCGKCRTRLFRYKKKNGTKSNLVKCFVERIVQDGSHVLEHQGSKHATTFQCPSCETVFARSATIRGLPALKLVGGKTRMTKK